jgi:DNA polymerase-3 subunit beta
MKASITKDNLAKGISIVSRAVSTRSTLPALSSILIASDGQRLRLQATDLTKAITCWIDARVDEPGALAVPAKTLADTVAAIAAGEEIDLSVDTKTGTLLLKAGRSKTEVKGISAEDFPIIPAGDQADIWSESIEMVRPTCSRSSAARRSARRPTKPARC